MLYDEDLSQRLSMPPYTDSNNNSNGKTSTKDKYSLRPRSIRRRNPEVVEDEVQVPQPVLKRSPKPKQKPAPLSKYRRKTANARERSRMREINQAFETLRRVVPQLSEAHTVTNEKLTKITTLRLAMKYISTLSATLTGGSDTSSSSSPDLISDCSELDLLLESDGESLPLHSDFSDHSADFGADFADDPLAHDFSPLSPDLSHHLTHFDPFLADFS
ncbi:PREDICTED: helix-loop-helix protein delilah-like [Nicrophorus vespilloides]|uniref:Helix-loop-helix protein delilah-like n=1 Tax=Nicrophorus vespilloides TaxID=110193 RepID=A0ABM1NH72_NICVS|nr:PREDICTED: helix-loop-helix protein delilah-like [Nicrophorus vespilloides]